MDEPQLLSGPESNVAGWVQHLGYDDNCVAIDGEEQCAWFTWENDNVTIQWRAVGAQGAHSTIRSHVGRFPSGDTGQVDLGHGHYERRKLLAFVSADHTQVYGAILDNAGLIEDIVLVRNVPSPYLAYQTSVSWSSREERWLVAWAENELTIALGGRVMTATVEFSGGNVGSANQVLECDKSSPFTANAAPTATDGTRNNPKGYCYGIWMASSYYSRSNNDRYRIHQYAVHARLNTNGAKVADVKYALGTGLSPVTEAAFDYESGYAPFQQFVRDSPIGSHWRLIQDSFTRVDNQPVTVGGFDAPQAFRSNGSVAVAVASGMQPPYSSQLVLSIVDVRRDGCPPRPSP